MLTFLKEMCIRDRVSGLQPGDEVVVSDMSNYKNKNKLKLK